MSAATRATVAAAVSLAVTAAVLALDGWMVGVLALFPADRPLLLAFTAVAAAALAVLLAATARWVLAETGPRAVAGATAVALLPPAALQLLLAGPQ